MKTTCAYCSEVFNIRPSKLKKSKSGLVFCCREHKDLSARKSSDIPIKPKHYFESTKISLLCNSCNKEYSVDKHREYKSKYCSQHCMFSARVRKEKTKLSLICGFCDKPFTSYHNDICCTYCRFSFWRVRTKKKAVEYMGNRCSDCQKTYHLCAYDFHHLADKDFEISKAVSWSRLEIELKKCVLLCSNCHRVRHNKASMDRKLEYAL